MKTINYLLGLLFISLLASCTKEYYTVEGEASSYEYVITDYGADAYGGGDCSGIINKLIEDMPLSGGCIVIPEGTFVLDNPIEINKNYITIKGVNSGMRSNIDVKELDLLIGAGGGFNAFDISKWFVAPASLVYNLAAGLSAPIFNQHEIRALWEEAKSNQKIALSKYHETALKAYEEVVNLLIAQDNISERYKLKEEESKTHHRSIRDANELFRLSFVGYLEVLSADERYLDCELERIQLNTYKCINNVYLYRALGGGVL